MKRRQIAVSWLVLLVILVPALSFMLKAYLGQNWRLSNEPLHSTVEAIGATAAILLALLLTTRNDTGTKGVLLLVSAGFLSMGILDAFHAIRHPGQGFVFLHSTASLVGAIFFVLVWLPENILTGLKRGFGRILAVVATGSVLFGVFVVLQRQWFPLMVINQQFTSTAIAINLLAGIMFLVSALYFVLDFLRTHDRLSYLFACMFVLFGMAELAFKYSSLWDSTWWLWHVLSFSAYALALAFIVNDYLRATSRIRLSDKELRKVNRALKTLSECNQAIIRANSEAELLESVCGSIVSVGGYKMVWVGYAVDDSDKSVLPVAQAGCEENYLGSLSVSWADNERGRNPSGLNPLGVKTVGEAVRTGKPVIARNAVAIDGTARMGDLAPKGEYASSIALPLIANGKVLGALNICASECDAFDEA